MGGEESRETEQHKGNAEGAIFSFLPLRMSLTFSHQDLNRYKHLQIISQSVLEYTIRITNEIDASFHMHLIMK